MCIRDRFRYMHFPFTENKGSQQIDLLDFETIVETIAEGIEKGERMLVFSVNGQGAVAAVIGYLMVANKWTIIVASSYVLKMRTEVQEFNKDLFLQLNKWSCDRLE
eukprot:TRINITY_DN1295_c0_g1_i15.p1 TRINITY_DN1295_c0_g1~~TRINITY_DN1295_c0_g1_i15.p1  ORF type:complete len:121 (+),score=25.09 TRINITY_DN1295_c0_g1_i15:47-364(+)